MQSRIMRILYLQTERKYFHIIPRNQLSPELSLCVPGPNAKKNLNPNALILLFFIYFMSTSMLLQNAYNTYCVVRLFSFLCRALRLKYCDR